MRRCLTQSVALACSATQSCPTLWPCGLQHARPPRPSASPGAGSDSGPLSRWCHPTISSSVVSFSSCLQSFPASGSFQMTWLFALGRQILEFQLHHQSFMEYSGLLSFTMDWLDLLAVQGTLKSLLQNHSSKASILQHSAFFMIQLSHPYDNWKNHSFHQIDLCWQRNISVF